MSVCVCVIDRTILLDWKEWALHERRNAEACDIEWVYHQFNMGATRSPPGLNRLWYVLFVLRGLTCPRLRTLWDWNLPSAYNVRLFADSCFKFRTADLFASARSGSLCEPPNLAGSSGGRDMIKLIIIKPFFMKCDQRSSRICTHFRMRPKEKSIVNTC